jgi:butyryl-CoA dehydrogenase
LTDEQELIREAIKEFAACASTGVILSAHTSLATWPIYKFGTPAQHDR